MNINNILESMAQAAIDVFLPPIPSHRSITVLGCYEDVRRMNDFFIASHALQRFLVSFQCKEKTKNVRSRFKIKSLCGRQKRVGLEMGWVGRKGVG